MDAVTHLAPTVGVVAACDSLCVARASFYRQRPVLGPPASPAPAPAVPSVRPPPPRALSPVERASVLTVLHEERFQDCSPAAVQATLLDEGQYLCSIRTMYRILEDEGESGERRDQLVHPAYQRPELLATAPNQLWSWDITKLRGAAKWTYFYLYVILDVFSRYVVGWMIAPREGAELAKQFIEETIGKQQVPAGQLTIHADRGKVMTSKSPVIAQQIGGTMAKLMPKLQLKILDQVCSQIECSALQQQQLAAEAEAERGGRDVTASRKRASPWDAG